MDNLDWWDYHGEPLCPRCGTGVESGDRYKVCAEYGRITYKISWDDPEDGAPLKIDASPHEMACERYCYGDLCAGCETAMMQSESLSASVGSDGEA